MLFLHEFERIEAEAFLTLASEMIEEDGIVTAEEDALLAEYAVSLKVPGFTYDAAAAAASTVVAAHNNSPNAHADLLHLRQNSKVYAVGDIAFSAALPSYLVLECTTPGTTAATEPDFSGAVEGGTVTDGTVVWTYKGLLSDDGANPDLSNLTTTGEDHFLEQDFTIIYPNGGSEGSPASITVNSEYIESNPFPGYRVFTQVELLYNSEWGVVGFSDYWHNAYVGFGTFCAQHNDDTLHLTTGSNTLLINGSYKYMSQGYTWTQVSTNQNTLPCRIKVWKIGKVSA